MPRVNRDPRQRYEARLVECEAAGRALAAASARWSWVRLGLGLATVALLYGIVAPRTVPWPWLAAPVVAFLAVARRHDRTLRRKARTERAARYNALALARLDGRFAGAGDTQSYAEASHPYAADLDLFGHGSLFDLISRARTRHGATRLAGWLLAPGSIAEIRARHEAVDELRERYELREDLAVLGAEVGAQVRTEALAEWAEGAARLPHRKLVRAAAFILALTNVGGAVLWLSGMTGIALFAASAAASALVALFTRRAVGEVLHSLESPSEELSMLSETLARVGREGLASARLATLRSTLLPSGQEPAASRIAALARRADWHASRHNPLFAPIAALLNFGTQLACSVETWRGRSGRDVRRWLEALAEFEALASLACHAAENPADPFPDLVEGGPCFSAEALGHPLLRAPLAIRNDVALGREPALLVVSGSNMSGKSTLLRSVGLNAVLALAGAPVRARRLELSRLQVGACMRVVDSIQAGTSHFYAEILRLKQLVDLSQEGPPLLFLLDEVLHGTNSHDRRIGAEALVRGLLARGAIGLVTTHDLALAKIADDLAQRAFNVHFVDELIDGKMVFDYRLHAGVVQKSNALALMRAVGLTVPEGER